MQTIYERLPKNCTAKAYMTIVIDITHSLVAYTEGKCACLCLFV